jgi:hypothetical protein
VHRYQAVCGHLLIVAGTLNAASSTWEVADRRTRSVGLSRPTDLGDRTSRYVDDQLWPAGDAFVELVPARVQHGKHRAPYRSAPDRATHDTNVREVGSMARADRPNLDLHVGHGLRHDNDERAHVCADVEDYRALSCMRILVVHGGGGHGDVVPGIVW